MCSPIDWLSLSSKWKENVNLALLWDWKKKFQVFNLLQRNLSFCNHHRRSLVSFFYYWLPPCCGLHRGKSLGSVAVSLQKKENASVLCIRILLKLQLFYWIRLRNLYMLIGICFWTFFALVLDILTGHCSVACCHSVSLESLHCTER